MMGEQTVMQEALFYSFSLERHVPSDHMLRSIDRFVENSNSTRWWNDVPHGTMDEVRSYVRLDLPVSVCRQDRPKDCSTSFSNPMLEGPWCRFRREARARERRRHCHGE